MQQHRNMLASICLGCLLVGCGANPTKSEAKLEQPASKPTSITAPASHQPAAVKLETLSHEQLQARLAAARGRVVVLDCWATFCAPCLKEFPRLVELSRKYPADKLQCVSLSFDNQGLDSLDKIAPSVQAFLDQRQAANVLNVLSTDEDSLLYEKLGFAAIPTVFVYDQQGTLVKKFPSPESPKFEYGQVERLVAELLANPVLK